MDDKNNQKTAQKAPHVLVVEARFYGHIADMQVQGAMAVLEKAGATYDRVSVPGALEIPAAIAFAACDENKGPRYDAFVALGCVIRGETTHYDTVANESARGIMQLSVEKHLAIGNGILTVENEPQAIARADMNQKDKGGGAAQAALAMLALKKRFCEN